jgi:8-oxo-dGTP pyrophosphatase MutT (NUDIX family)
MSERRSGVSVAVVLENVLPDQPHLAGGIVLVRKRDSGLIGLIAGHLEKVEPEIEGLRREIKEETGLTPRHYVLSRKRRVMLVPRFGRPSSVGVVYDGWTKSPLSMEGYQPDLDEIAWVKPYTLEEILDLIAHPELMYKPEYNLMVLSHVVLRYLEFLDDEDKPWETTVSVARGCGIETRFVQSYLRIR